MHLLRPLIKCSNFRVPTRRQRNGVAQLVEALQYKSEGRGFDLEIPEICHSHNMALGSTQPLREMSTRNISWGGGKGGHSVRLTTFMCRLSRNLGASSCWTDIGTKNNMSVPKKESLPGRSHCRAAPVLTELCRLQLHGSQAKYSLTNISPNSLPSAFIDELYCMYLTTQFDNCTWLQVVSPFSETAGP